MFKNTISLSKSTYSFVFACSLLITVASCSGRFAKELKLVNQLEQQLDSNQQNLNLDAPLFQIRAEHIESTLRTFTNDYKEEMTKELGDNLSKYKNFQKIYKRQTNTYYDCVKEQEALRKQLENLTKDLENGKWSKEEFKTYYSTEKTDVNLLISKSKEIGKNLYEIEPEYTRLTAYFEPILAEMQP